MTDDSNDRSRGVRRIPRATYRVQLNKDFTFAAATRIVPYLARLGISHLYCSPIFTARPGSLHGYDVIDHGKLNPELGTREEFDELVATLHRHHLGMIVDIVPNHLGVMGEGNAWWLDVLENGPCAQHAAYFDIDWRPNRASMHHRILVPVLGAPYGKVLEAGEFKISYDAGSGAFQLRYFNHVFPVDPRTYPLIFSPAQEQLAAGLPLDDDHRQDFESLLDAFGRLPPRENADDDTRAIRYRDKEVHKRRLVRLCERSPQIARHIENTVALLNGQPGKPDSFDALDRVIEAQAYRLASWRVAVDEINYRRFFDVNDLAALRMELPQVFESTHALLFELINNGSIDGLRIDHPDGLYDPKQYFEHLQARFRRDDDPKPLYVVVEKILAAHERLPEDWPVHGTTGYEFAGLLNSWFACGKTETSMTRLYRSFSHRTDTFDEVTYESRKLVMRIALAAEVGVLATQLDRIAQLDRHTADFTRAALRDAIIEVIACFPVYRTYISAQGPNDEDRRVIQWAVGIARKRGHASELTVFDFLRDVLLGDAADGRNAEYRRLVLEFARKFQQVTAPVMAKGVEDTSFYRYYRLISLNEVGGEPRRYGLTTHQLHQSNLERSRRWPHSMIATSTHDTKRSEDVRTRISVLSEIPDIWRKHLSRWTRVNASKRREVDGTPAPSENDEYMLYQTLVGVWPLDAAGQRTPELGERVRGYLTKAAREAKLNTSWINPNAEYEAALLDFASQLLEPAEHNSFLWDFSGFAERVAYFGHLNSLVQTTLKLTSPGIPDLFQGTELPVLSLVDPDNRRPVDYERAGTSLEAIQAAAPSGSVIDKFAADWMSGCLKLHVTQSLLALRRDQPALFSEGSYEPLKVGGEWSEHVAAFARRHGNISVVVVVARCLARLTNGDARELTPPFWEDTHIEVPTDLTGPEVNELRCVLGGEQVPLRRDHEAFATMRMGDALARLPVAVYLVQRG